MEHNLPQMRQEMKHLQIARTHHKSQAHIVNRNHTTQITITHYKSQAQAHSTQSKSQAHITNHKHTEQIVRTQSSQDTEQIVITQ